MQSLRLTGFAKLDPSRNKHFHHKDFFCSEKKLTVIVFNGTAVNASSRTSALAVRWRPTFITVAVLVVIANLNKRKNVDKITDT